MRAVEGLWATTDRRRSNNNRIPPVRRTATRPAYRARFAAILAATRLQNRTKSGAGGRTRTRNFKFHLKISQVGLIGLYHVVQIGRRSSLQDRFLKGFLKSFLRDSRSLHNRCLRRFSERFFLHTTLFFLQQKKSFHPRAAKPVSHVFAACFSFIGGARRCPLPGRCVLPSLPRRAPCRHPL